MLDLARRRPPLGPNLLARHEAALRALDATGLDDVAKTMVIDVLHNFLLGALSEVREAREIERHSGLTDEQWFDLARPALRSRLEPDRFPYLLRMSDTWQAADKATLADPDTRFRFGLDVVLDGIDALIQARRGGLARTPRSL